jgi:hypothetical protein
MPLGALDPWAAEPGKGVPGGRLQGSRGPRGVTFLFGAGVQLQKKLPLMQRQFVLP